MSASGKRILRIGTRGSKLALAQSGQVQSKLAGLFQDRELRLVQLQTEGDRDANTALAALPEVGVFTKAIEQALIENRCDIAVHSLKDLPVAIDPRFALAAVPRRLDPADVLAGPAGIDELPRGAAVGTGSPRRKALLLAARPDLDVRSIRGNVDTRLKKLENGELAAVVLAAAGLERLGLTLRTHRLDPERFCPAPGQGALALECRADDEEVIGILAALEDEASRRAVEAERAFLAAVGGGCSLPVGAYAQVNGELMTVSAVVLATDGSQCLRDRWQGPADAGEAGARELAEWLLARGGDKILRGLSE